MEPMNASRTTFYYLPGYGGRVHTGLGQALLSRGVDLAGRGVGAEQDFFGAGGRLDVERIPHVAGWVVGGDVEELEVERVGLDLGGLPHLEAHLGEDVGNHA